MFVDFIHQADSLQRELQDFYQALRRNDVMLLQEARERLRLVLGQVESLAEDPGQQWNRMPVRQRWGYLRLASYVGTAAHELSRVEISR